MQNNIGFVPPKISPQDAIGIINQAADNIQADGKNHKVLQEAIRVLTDIVQAHLAAKPKD